MLPSSIKQGIFEDASTLHLRIFFMDVSVMFLAVLNLIGFETESGKELFVGLPTTLDLGFDRVTVP